jgi:hypothetical protein
MNIEREVFEFPGLFLSERKKWAMKFTEWCHEQHLCFSNGSSADLFRVSRPFGMYPAVFDLPSPRVRDMLALLLSCWRWSHNLRDAPEYCELCDSIVNSWHILFRCQRGASVRESFARKTGINFELEAFGSREHGVEIARTCSELLRIVPV